MGFVTYTVPVLLRFLALPRFNTIMYRRYQESPRWIYKCGQRLSEISYLLLGEPWARCKFFSEMNLQFLNIIFWTIIRPASFRRNLPLRDWLRSWKALSTSALKSLCFRLAAQFFVASCMMCILKCDVYNIYFLSQNILLRRISVIYSFDQYFISLISVKCLRQMNYLKKMKSKLHYWNISSTFFVFFYFKWFVCIFSYVWNMDLSLICENFDQIYYTLNLLGIVRANNWIHNTLF